MRPQGEDGHPHTMEGGLRALAFQALDLGDNASGGLQPQPKLTKTGMPDHSP